MKTLQSMFQLSRTHRDHKLPHLASIYFPNLAHTRTYYLQVATFGIYLAIFQHTRMNSTSCHNWHLFISQIWKFCETGSEVGYIKRTFSSVQAFCPVAESATTGNFWICRNRQFWESSAAESGIFRRHKYFSLFLANIGNSYIFQIWRRLDKLPHLASPKLAQTRALSRSCHIWHLFFLQIWDIF